MLPFCNCSNGTCSYCMRLDLATLRAQLAEVTRERDDRIEAIIRAHDALRDGRGHDAFVALNEYAVIGRIAKEPKP